MPKNSFFRSGSLALVAGLSQQGFALIHFIFAVRWLLPEALGTWAMFLVLVSFIDMARLGLIQNALVHFGTHKSEEKPQIFSASLSLSVGVNVVGAFILLILSFLLKNVWQMPDLPILVLNYFVLAVITGILRFVEGARMMEQDFRTSATSAFIFGFNYLLFTIIIKLCNAEITGLSLLWLQIPAAALTLAVVWRMNRQHLIFGHLKKEWITKIFLYGRYAMGTNLCSMIFQRADVILLGAFVSPAALAVYNVATRIISYLDFPLNALGLALLPKIAAEHNVSGSNGVIRLYEKSVGWLLAMTLPIALVTFFGADIIIKVMTGGKFAEAALLVKILAVSGLVKPWGRLFGITLDAIGKPHWNFRMLLLSMFVTIVVNLIFIPQWGIIGAAIASALSIVLTISIGQILLNKWLPVKVLKSFDHILPTYQSILKKVSTRFNFNNSL